MEEARECTQNPVSFSPRRSPRLKRKAQEEGSECVDSVDPAPPPAVGMVFNTFEEIEQFYKKYAQQQGFGVTRTQGAYSARRERRATTWKCECWGDPNMKAERKLKMCVTGCSVDDAGKSKQGNAKKCFCTAMVYASLNAERRCVVRKVVLEHANHTPMPEDSKLVKEYRMQTFTRRARRRLINDTSVGVSVGQVHAAMASERGGYENMPFTASDMWGELRKEKMLKMVGGDSNALVTYFEKMQQENPNFFHTHRLDEEGKMKDVLWVDARSRAAYEEFGDVVCFDTTYLTNEYLLPFANFVGVNHHGDSVLFGCALVSHEDCDTFEWVFSKWLMCMRGKEPGGILTDQAAAMRGPLEVVMPNTKHRWCMWHILQKLSFKVGHFEGYEDFKKELLEVVHNSISVAEFETWWPEVVSKYEVQDNVWLQNLFEERHMWVPVFMTDHFWAGMRSTQRVESIHSFFDKFITRHTMLHEFGERYITAVEKRAADEKMADAKSKKWVRNYATGYSAERFFRKIYTTNKFKSVQKECERMTYCCVMEERGLENKNIQYLMEDRVWVLPKGYSEEVLTNRRTFYCVEFNPETREAVCQCKKFETCGIMCRHLLRVYDRNHIDEIPSKFVMRRWRKDVVRKHSNIKVAHHDLAKSEETVRVEKMWQEFEVVTDTAGTNDKYMLIVLDWLKELKTALATAVTEDELSEKQSPTYEPGGDSSSRRLSHIGPGLTTTSPLPMSAGSQTGGVEDGVITPLSHSGLESTIKDPPIKKKRGRPRTSCHKSPLEPGQKKKKATSSKGKKGNSQTTQDASQPGAASDVLSTEGSKLPVKRKQKSVTFADVMAPSDRTIPIDLGADDDLMQRNMVSFT